MLINWLECMHEHKDTERMLYGSKQTSTLPSPVQGTVKRFTLTSQKGTVLGFRAGFSLSLRIHSRAGLWSKDEYCVKCGLLFGGGRGRIIGDEKIRRRAPWRINMWGLLRQSPT